MGVHFTPAVMIEREVDLALVGCGGTGSQMLTGIARIAAALRGTDHPGLQLTAYDPDIVTEANVGRQLFHRHDIGLNKATVLVHRVNQNFGTAWRAVPRRFTTGASVVSPRRPDLVVSCVDTRAARIEIDEIGKGIGAHYWMDLGNRRADGQVILGEWPGHLTTFRKSRSVGATEIDIRRMHVPQRLPTVLELFPEIRASKDSEDDGPSCSLAAALERQDLFVNQAVATAALIILWHFFHEGRISWHGAFVNAQTGHSRPLPVDPEAWGRLGYGRQKRRVAA